MIKRSKKIIASLLMVFSIVSVLPCTQTFATSEEGKKVIDTNKKNIVSRSVITVNGNDELEMLTSGKDKSQLILNGKMLKDQWYEYDHQLLSVDEDGKETLVNQHSKVYLDENGYKLTGWQVIDGEKYYMGAKGVTMLKGESGKYEKYLFDDDGKLITDPVKVKYSDKEYTIADDGKSVTMKVDGVEYNVPKDESLANDNIVEKDGKYYIVYRELYTNIAHITKSKRNGDYYSHEDGILAKNEWIYTTRSNSPVWYYFGPDYKIVLGYQTINGKKYYFNKWGVLEIGWNRRPKNENFFKSESGIGINEAYKLDEAAGRLRYHSREDGTIQEGWIQDKGKWYYIYSDGLMATNTTTPDGYWVDKYGVWKK